jgi:aldehyde dehydrogenase (NAD+)
VEVFDQLYIAGRWVAPAGSATIEVISPSTEELIGRVPEATADDVDRAVAGAREAFDHGPWPHLAAAERGAILSDVANLIRAEMQELAGLIAGEAGSPVSWGLLGQVLAPTMILDYYAGLAAAYRFETVEQAMLGQVLVRREPVGVVGAIAPWNVPLFSACAKLAPALLAGCTVVFKPAPETPLSALRLARYFEQAGLPDGVLSVIPAGRDVGEHLVTSPGVDKISFTGSTAAGRRIASLCGESVRRVSLELGGKSAAILLDDVDLDAALPMLLPNALMNSGQACIAQTRILAPRDRYDEVVEGVVEGARKMVVGSAMDPATEIGPLVAARQRQRVEGYIALGQQEGAKVATGGGRPAGLDRGFYVEPTVFTGVDNTMRIAQEEIFGPVLTVIAYDGDEQAVAIANDSDYGLCGSVYGADNERGLAVARAVRTGTYMLNSSIPLDFATPFGGYKRSGIGREFGPDGLELFLEKKSISLPAGYTPEL